MSSPLPVAKYVLYMQALSPYLAVIVGLYLWHNAWLSIALYHAMILLWHILSGGPRLAMRGWDQGAFWVFVAPSAIAGFLCFCLMPRMLRVDITLSGWLQALGLESWGLIAFMPYFGLLHPVLEQRHWQPLREALGWQAHLLFAGYHALVLSMILQPLWLLLCLFILVLISKLWQAMTTVFQGSLMAIASHCLADSALMIAIILLMMHFPQL